METETRRIPLGRLVEELVEIKALEIVRRYDLIQRNQQPGRSYNARLLRFLNKEDSRREQELCQELERREKEYRPKL